MSQTVLESQRWGDAEQAPRGAWPFFRRCMGLLPGAYAKCLGALSDHLHSKRLWHGQWFGLSRQELARRANVGETRAAQFLLLAVRVGLLQKHAVWAGRRRAGNWYAFAGLVEAGRLGCAWQGQVFAQLAAAAEKLCAKGPGGGRARETRLAALRRSRIALVETARQLELFGDRSESERLIVQKVNDHRENDRSDSEQLILKTKREPKTKFSQERASDRSPPGKNPAQQPIQEDEMRAFDELFEAYPEHRRDRFYAEMAWDTLPLLERAEIREILAGLERWKQSTEWTEDGGKYVPSLEKFIRQRKWQAKPPEGGSRGKTQRSTGAHRSSRPAGYYRRPPDLVVQ